MRTHYPLAGEEIRLATEMANTHLSPELASDEIRTLNGKVWLDDSLQGWNSVSLAKAAHDRKLTLSEDSPDLSGNHARNGIIFLGYYRSDPREIVLFQRAIQLVAELPEFKNAEIDELLLFKSVLFHEIGHWLTLIPGSHDSRIKRVGKSFPSEEAESLTELLNWMVFSQSTEAGDVESRRLLQCQYFKRNRGPVWQYQVYPFWLVATGIVKTQSQIEGQDTAVPSKEACEYLSKWLRESREKPSIEETAKGILNHSFPKPDAIVHLLPGFPNSSSILTSRIDALVAEWVSLLVLQANNDDILGVLDI